MTRAVLSGIWLAYSIVYAALLIGAAGMAFRRLGSTPAGVVLAGALVLSAVKALALNAAHRLFLDPERSAFEADQLFSIASNGSDLCLGLAIAAGLGMIPMALGRRTVT